MPNYREPAAKPQCGKKPHAAEDADRHLRPTPRNPKRVRAMEIARRSFRAYAETYKALAE
jgi:hypothetical protein